MCLYRIYILPVLFYGCEAWTITNTISERLDEFDTWCLRKFSGYHIPGTLQTRQFETLLLVHQSLKWSGSAVLDSSANLIRTAPAEDHRRIISTALRPPADWRRPAGRPRTPWLKTVDEGIQPQKFGVHTAWRKAIERRLATSHQQAYGNARGNALAGVRQEEEEEEEELWVR